MNRVFHCVNDSKLTSIYITLYSETGICSIDMSHAVSKTSTYICMNFQNSLAVCIEAKLFTSNPICRQRQRECGFGEINTADDVEAFFDWMSCLMASRHSFLRDLCQVVYVAPLLRTIS